MPDLFLVMPVLGIEHSCGCFDEAPEGSPRHSLGQFNITGLLEDENALLVEVGNRTINPDDRRRQRTLPKENDPSAECNAEAKALICNISLIPATADCDARETIRSIPAVSA